MSEHYPIPGDDPAARHPRVHAPRTAYTFVLNSELVERALREVAEQDVIRSIEAALIAAIDFQRWREAVRSGRDVTE